MCALHIYAAVQMGDAVVVDTAEPTCVRRRAGLSFVCPLD